MMTKLQTSLYWREWAAVRKVKPDADRHALHVVALGAPKSSNDFGNQDLDAVLATFRAISRPADLRAQMRQTAQPRMRQLHAVNEAIKCLAVYVEDPIEYVTAIIRDKFKRCETIRDLGDKPYEWTDRNTGAQRVAPSQLEQLRMHIWGNINRKGTGLRAKAGHSLHDMYCAAGLQCPCKACADARRLDAQAQPGALGSAAGGIGAQGSAMEHDHAAGVLGSNVTLAPAA